VNESPAGWLAAGLGLCVLGGVLTLVDATALHVVAFALLAAGGLVTQVCVVALGVAWGLQRHAYLRGDP
jgi:hypothetical protein